MVARDQALLPNGGILSPYRFEPTKPDIECVVSLGVAGLAADELGASLLLSKSLHQESGRPTLRTSCSVRLASLVAGVIVADFSTRSLCYVTCV
jgi:hypothetical protein